MCAVGVCALRRSTAASPSVLPLSQRERDGKRQVPWVFSLTSDRVASLTSHRVSGCGRVIKLKLGTTRGSQPDAETKAARAAAQPHIFLPHCAHFHTPHHPTRPAFVCDVGRQLQLQTRRVTPNGGIIAADDGHLCGLLCELRGKKQQAGTPLSPLRIGSPGPRRSGVQREFRGRHRQPATTRRLLTRRRCRRSRERGLGKRSGEPDRRSRSGGHRRDHSFASGCSPPGTSTT